MIKVAYFTPLNPRPTGIADYSEELLPYLAQHLHIELFVDGYSPSNKEITARFPVRDVSEFAHLRRAGRYDVALYQMGNSISHAFVLRTLVRVPGVTVLHDFVLHHLVAELTVGRGDGASYIREMGYSHGPEGATAARRAVRRAREFPYLQFPLNRRVLDASLGTVVHSNCVRSWLAIQSPEALVTTINHFAPAASSTEASQVRRGLGIGPEHVLFASFGLVTPEKRIDVVLRAFQQVHRRLPEARFLIVGDSLPHYSLAPLIADLGLAGAVRCLGFVAKEDLLAYINAVDVGIALRWPTMGETSGVVLRLLGAGRPVVVSDVGWYAEIPADCCKKIPVDGNEGEALIETMLALAASAQERESLGQRASAHVKAQHSVERSAAEYAQFLERALAGR